MSTYHAVTIATPVPIDLATLPYPLYDDGSGSWGLHDGDEWYDPAAPMCYGHSAYALDVIGVWAAAYTAAHPEVTVTWSQEWDDEEPGQQVTVYRAGVVVVAESKHTELVPDNLRELIADVRTALDAHGHLAYDAARQMFDAARALCDALDPAKPARLRCDECDEPAASFWPDLAVPVQLCEGCEHDARRSGWAPGRN